MGALLIHALAARLARDRFEVTPQGEEPVSRQTILVVDDEETICEIVSRPLQNEGFLCVTAHSGEAALEWLRTNTRWPDLFIIDVRLPGMSGPEFLLETLRIRQGTPVLYISGYPQHILEKG